MTSFEIVVPQFAGTSFIGMQAVTLVREELVPEGEGFGILRCPADPDEDDAVGGWASAVP